jgi:predicted amidophosphoribosyltransferase
MKCVHGISIRKPCVRCRGESARRCAACQMVIQPTRTYCGTCERIVGADIRGNPITKATP